jgi:predicted transcriptional regulator
MGQEEVYRFLKNNPKEWFSSKEISAATERSVGSVTVCLKKLRNRNDIQYKRKTDRKHRYLYKF